MRITKLVVAAVVVALMCSAGGPVVVRAADAQVGGVPVTLKLTVVLSRFNGEKKVGNLPFQIMVIPGSGERGDGDQTSLQTGARVPVPQTTFSADKTTPTTSYNYQQFGTNISASARTLDPTTFNVGLTVTDSQLLSDAPDQAQYASGVRLPRYQSFTSSNRLILRDGQTVQYTAATDKTSGEVIKLDVTLNVIK